MSVRFTGRSRRHPASKCQGLRWDRKTGTVDNGARKSGTRYGRLVPWWWHDAAGAGGQC